VHYHSDLTVRTFVKHTANLIVFLNDELFYFVDQNILALAQRTLNLTMCDAFLELEPVLYS